MPSKEIVMRWKNAVNACGGVEIFEEKILPNCSDAVKTCWAFVKPEVAKEAKSGG